METNTNQSGFDKNANGSAHGSADVTIETNSDIQTIGENSSSLNVVTMSLEIGHSSTYKSISKKVKVKIEYPKDWKNPKFMADGDIKEVSEDTAQTFVELGIGTIIKD